MNYLTGFFGAVVVLSCGTKLGIQKLESFVFPAPLMFDTDA